MSKSAYSIYSKASHPFLSHRLRGTEADIQTFLFVNLRDGRIQELLIHSLLIRLELISWKQYLSVCLPLSLPLPFLVFISSLLVFLFPFLLLFFQSLFLSSYLDSLSLSLLFSSSFYYPFWLYSHFHFKDVCIFFSFLFQCYFLWFSFSIVTFVQAASPLLYYYFEITLLLLPAIPGKQLTLSLPRPLMIRQDE